MRVEITSDNNLVVILERFEQGTPVLIFNVKFRVLINRDEEETSLASGDNTQGVKGAFEMKNSIFCLRAEIVFCQYTKSTRSEARRVLSVYNKSSDVRSHNC